jgi:hypothetical protein
LIRNGRPVLNAFLVAQMAYARKPSVSTAARRPADFSMVKTSAMVAAVSMPGYYTRLLA